MNNVKIIGTGSYAPNNIFTNADLEKIVDTSDEWITSRTGIKERRICTNETTSDLAYKAALKAIENSDINREDIDLIIVATITGDNFTPAVANLVQAKLGLNDKHITAFDINAACSGFLYAMNVATQMIKTGQNKTALIIGAESLSKIIDWKDRNTCVLFGDGAGAVVISQSDEESVQYFYTNSKGDTEDLLLSQALPLNYPDHETDNKINQFLVMNGREVFKFATRAIEDALKNVCINNNLDYNDIDLIVPHQANLRIVSSVAKTTGININKFFINLDKYGNTSAASIPLALDEANKNGLLKDNDNVVLVGFGGGLTWGGCLIKWKV